MSNSREESDEIEDHPLADHFNSLSPEQILKVVELGPWKCTGRFLALNSYENRVYQLEMDDGTWVVGKFYRPGRWSESTIMSEHQFLAELSEQEIPVAAPLKLGDGTTLGSVGGILYALFPRIGGRNPQELDDDQVRKLGRLLGRIHNVGSGHETKNRLNLDPSTYGRANLEYLMAHNTIPEQARDIYAETVMALLKRIEPIFEGVPAHRIHGDCHLGNLVDSRNGFVFLDFDDMLIGPAVQDVWMLVPSYDEHGKRQRDILLESYGEFRRFDAGWLQLIEPLRALRFIHYSSWIARRWKDPIFKKTFSFFGTLQYWQKEIQDLREQIARIDDFPVYSWN